MQKVVSLDAPAATTAAGVRRAKFRAGVRAFVPARGHAALAVLSAFLLILSFPDFDLWPLAWVGLVPLLVAVARVERARQAFALGWLAGALFFYGSCWWLTHSMIHYGGLPRPLAYALLVPVVLIVGLFPATFALALAHLRARRGVYALVAAPPLWAASEWARLGMTGQLWNAVGYSQAFHPALIQTATWGGVYAVGFCILAINVALTLLYFKRDARALAVAGLTSVAVALMIWLSARGEVAPPLNRPPDAVVIAVQPNVSVNFGRSPEETAALVSQHLEMSHGALNVASKDLPGWDAGIDVRDDAAREARNRAMLAVPRLVVWPESPMNFAYANDWEFRALVGDFARRERASVLFNSLEPAPAGGAYNSAVLVNEAGRLVAQYDKIRLLPFGEYVPLPRWFPPAWLVSGIVGEFTPGTNYTLLPVGDETRAGVFICFESAFPSIARRFTDAGADVLINISNDGYLGETPVLRQHLANAVFRAVENRRDVLRVTNTGISARISPRGVVGDATGSFQPAVRTWTITRATGGKTFYTRHGDLFVALCAALSILLIATTIRRTRASEQ
ncbi:MAG: apolipoprotein N-acyltransferase [Acidobacteriota bacterium]|nr:apolipoprotein N-acyltransferase [Acidobacteriota bacterium]